VPTYQYACTDCGDRSEVVQRFTDDPLTVCSACGGKLRKVFSPVGIVFKGSGFYKNDSRNGGGKRPKGGDASKSETTKADTPAKSDNGSGDSKSTASKSDAKPSTPAAKST
jgi:putative FmdB family regulatory protein